MTDFKENASAPAITKLSESIQHKSDKTVGKTVNATDIIPKTPTVLLISERPAITEEYDSLNVLPTTGTDLPTINFILFEATESAPDASTVFNETNDVKIIPVNPKNQIYVFFSISQVRDINENASKHEKKASEHIPFINGFEKSSVNLETTELKNKKLPSKATAPNVPPEAETIAQNTPQNETIKLPTVFVTETDVLTRVETGTQSINEISDVPIKETVSESFDISQETEVINITPKIAKQKYNGFFKEPDKTLKNTFNTFSGETENSSL